MAKISNYYLKSEIEFEFNFHKGNGFIYKKTQADYCNWIPYDFNLRVGEKNYLLQEFSLSLEGAKSFLKTMQDVLMERKSNIEYKEYCYCASEGEFTIYIKNVNECYEEEVVIVKIWVNSASLVEENAGYSIGYEFMVTYRALENFEKELKEELCEVLDLNNI